jgi:hypothetical protein
MSAEIFDPAEMSQPLPPGTGVFTRNKPRIAVDLPATGEPLRCPDDQNINQPGDGSHARMRHRPQHLGQNAPWRWKAVSEQTNKNTYGDEYPNDTTSGMLARQMSGRLRWFNFLFDYFRLASSNQYRQSILATPRQ